jgi:hypothetical protein
MNYSLDVDATNNDIRIKRKIYASKRNSLYLILNYDRFGISHHDYNATKYRSVVFSFPEKELLSYSPPKSLPIRVFMKTYPNINAALMNINEAIEGVMVNLFFDPRINKWEIATKKAVGGNYWFYGNGIKPQKTFHDMFLEAFSCNPYQNIGDIDFFNNLPKYASYTFILQHPENQIVFPVDRPRIFLVSVYSINQNKVEFVPSFMYENWNVFKNINCAIEFPKKYNPNSYSELFDTTMSKGEMNYGFVITNEFTGEMTKIVSSEYEILKKTMKSDPITQYHFLCLTRIGKINSYLDMATNRKKLCEARDLYEDFIINTYHFYIDHYVSKLKFKIPDKYYTHVYKIHHQIYLPSLKSKDCKRISLAIVRDYFNKLEPREFLYIINHDRRIITAGEVI